MNTKKVKLSENAQKVAESRYFLEGEDWEGCARRVANAIAGVEKDKVFYENEFFDMIYNMDFLAAGRILRNASRTKGNLLNCFVLPIGDSIEQIGDAIRNALVTWSNGGGTGFCFSELRPKGDPILGKGGTSSGLVSFIEAANAVSKTIESGGQRRAAALACVDVSHPEVIDFINAKMVDGKLSHFNISVMVNDDFLKAVERNDIWTFKFKQKEYNSMPARDIWKLIVTNMIKYAEPGLLNNTNLTKNNSYYYDPIISTNPCWSGDTFVAVADGRGEISFKQLAEEGKDVPVFSFNDYTKEVEIKTMRNPRLTSSNEKILKITLDDGSVLRCTENHKLINKKGEEVLAKDLKINDRLHHMAKNYGVNSKGEQEPVLIYNGYPNIKGYCFEHRLAAEFLLDRKLSDIETVHHIDENNQNNILNNLLVMKHGDHSSYHQKGSKNVMRDKWWNNQSDEIKSEYKKNMSKSTSGTKNGNWSGYTVDDLKLFAEQYMTKLGRKITVKEWVEVCKNNNLPYTITARSNFISEIYEKITLNYKIILIEEDGYEKVYNGTVDDLHNYYVYTKSGKARKNYILSKNCGEATLPAWGSCDLGSLVLPNFITGTTNTNWKKLERVIKLAIRFLDNVLDVNKYSLKEFEISANNSRRVGLGVMGLAEYLFAKEARYGSPRALFEIERLMKFIRDTCYEAGVELAEEKGAFPKFNSALFGNSSFVRKLPAELRIKIKEKGVRCVTMMSMAPTGTISLLAEVSGGIEPLLYRSYKRKDRVGERIYIHPKYKELLLSGEKVPDWFVDMGDLTAKDHFETQCLIQKYTDGAVSKTVNLPFGTTYEELDKLLLEYIYSLKGCTIYVESSREGQVYNRLTESETMDYILNSELEIKTDLTEEDKDCGLCEKKEDEIE